MGAGAALGLAVISEILCAGLIVLGLFTRWATIPLILTMAVAFFVIHISDPFGRQEMSILYGIAFIVIFLFGIGKFSADVVKSGK